MKKQFYFLLLLLSGYSIIAQTPGGVSGSVLWLKANSGASPATWTDNSGSGNNFSQAITGNQPALVSNAFNYYPALQFNGTSTFMTQPAPSNFPTANTDRSIFVVANATQTSGYRWILVYGNVGTVGGTCQVGNHVASLANDFYGADFETPNPYWNTAANANGALASFTLQTGTGKQFDRGNLLQTQGFPALSAPSANAVIGAIDGSPAETWEGNIAEIVMFDSWLSDAARNQVEAYLGFKYGFTIGNNTTPVNYVASDATTFWTASNTYQNDVFGIGTDPGSSITQTQSNSINSGSGAGAGQSGKGNLVLSSAAPLNDFQFLMIGNDAGVLTEQTIGAGEAPIGTVGSQRVARNWKVQNTGTVGAVDLSFDLTGLTYTGGSTASNYRLMVDADGDGNYATGTISYVIPASIAGNLLQFTNITLPNAAVFTVLTQASATLPAIWEGFNVSLQKNKATLTWKTSSEVNVDRYVAEYSQNGITYLTAGTVAAKNSAGLNTYTLVQENLPMGVRYYRIKRIDKDGQFQLSEVKSVRAGGLSTVVLKANPVVKGRLDMIINVPQNQAAVIRVVSVSGKVLVQQNTGLSTGVNNISTDIPRAAAGTYFLQVQLANEVINKKFVRL